MPPKLDTPPLAIYKTIAEYSPAYGDFVVWSGWFVTWNGVVSNYDEETGSIDIIFSTLPFLLFTMDPAEQAKNTKKLTLAKIRTSANGVFSVCQHNYTHNVTVWYI